MAQRSIADLIVNLRMNTASFVKELDKSRTLSTAFGVAVGSVMADIAKSAVRLGADLATALPHAFLQAAESADVLSKASQRVGIGIEALSGLKHGAELAGVEFGALEKGLGKLSSTALDASYGLQTNVRTFRDLGVEFKNADGTLRSTQDILGDVAERFAHLDDGTRKTALALDLFGRAGAQLIPLLNQGRAGLAASAAEAERLGLVISERTGRAAEQFNDNLSRLHSSLSGVALQLGQSLLPAFAALTDSFVKFVTDGGLVQRTGGAISGVFQSIARASLVTAQAVATVGAGFSILAEDIAAARLKAAEFFNFILPKFLEADTNFLAAELEKRSARVDEFAASIKGITELMNDLDANFASAFEELPKVARGDGGEAGRILAEQAQEAMQKRWKELQRPLQFTGFTDLPDVTLFGTMLQDFTELDRVVRQTPLWNRMEELRKSNEQINLDLSLTPKLIDAIDPKLAKVVGKTKDTSQAAKEARERFQDLAHTITSGFEDAILSGQGLRATLAGILEDIGRIILRATITGPSGILGTFLGSLGGVVGGIGGGGGAAASGGGFAAGTHALTGARASGGPVSAGGTYLVGEHGPELFSPSSHGMVSPAGTVVIQQTINMQSDGGNSRGQLLLAAEQIANIAARRAVEAIRQLQLRTA